MLALIRSIGSIISGIALVMVGNGVLSTTVSLRMAADGHGAPAVGVVPGAYCVGLTAGAVLIARVIRRVGPIRARFVPVTVPQAAATGRLENAVMAAGRTNSEPSPSDPAR